MDMDEYGMEQDMQEYGDEMDQYEMDQEGQMLDMQDGQMMDEMDEEYGEEDDDFMRIANDPQYAHMPPIDRMHKIRRNILQTINDMRTNLETPSTTFNVDPMAIKAANEYANYLLNGAEDEDKLDEICQNYHVVGKVIPLVGFAVLEEDEDHQGTIQEQLMDAHGLLLELEYELKVLADPKNTHIGIGFAMDRHQVKVVELVSQKPVKIDYVQPTADDGVECRGTVIDRETGIYAARIVAANKMNKDIIAVGPAQIQFDKGNGEFVLTIPGPQNDSFYSEDLKLIQFYVNTRQVDKIPYGEASNERINVAHSTLCLTLQMDYLPDPRLLDLDRADDERDAKITKLRDERRRQEEEINKKKKEDRLAEKEKQKQALQEGRDDRMQQEAMDMEDEESGKDGSQGEDEEDDDDEGTDSDMDQYGEEDSEDSDEIAELPSQNEMKRDLIQAIEEELREQDQLRRENEELQKQIILQDSQNFEQFDKQPDVNMNEHKYLNTLANVHQVRINLKETQDRYNKMASELQAKLNEKQAKCHEIESQFKELKRSVAQNAVFSRTGKKIPKKTLEEWEESESLKDQEVHQYRLQNIALRNRLANKEKILKKKEQLADGLHLIDFEQLKIENQTLNEKIEERNEELHKLRKKITQTVVILSHTREKLQFVQEKNRVHALQLQDLGDQLNTDKNEQSRLKKNREKLLKINLKLKQDTGIVSKTELKDDYNKRDGDIVKLQEKIKTLKANHQNLSAIIEQATEIQMKNMGN